MKIRKKYRWLQMIAHKRRWLRIPMCLSIVLVLAIIAILPSLHIVESQNNQHHHSFEHSIDKEEDPCHRKIYHRDFNKGCQHDSHYSVPIESCSLCDLFLNADVFSFFNPSASLNNYSNGQEISSSFSSFEHTCFCIFRGRAPPMA
ncbi:MAG: hypothetical protein IPM92_05195 [Saprospiraceae bacterium]|nr:hypothetical protein [Saprospiraceae bacterium]